MINLKEIVHKINDNAFGLGDKISQDYIAVISAKCSRNVNLDNITLDQDNIEQFLLTNLYDYGHASIGDLAYVGIYLKNITWLESITLLSTPLMNGQELSTRAVFNMKQMSLSCSNEYLESFNFFKNIMIKKRDLIDLQDRKYYFLDEIRFLRPGSASTNAVFISNARTICSKLDKLDNINFFKSLIQSCDNVMQEMIPNTWKCLRYKKRNPSLTDQFIFTTKLQPNNISIIPPHNLDINQLKNFMDANPRLNNHSMLDETISQFGLFKLRIQCSIAGARDFLRHRTANTWSKKLIINNQNQSIIYPYTDDIQEMQYVQSFINQYYFFDGDEIQKILFLPLASMIEIEGSFTLDKLIYLLELRAYSAGVHKEYEHISKNGLSILKNILCDDILLNQLHIVTSK